jgi:hypothetical protein
MSDNKKKIEIDLNTKLDTVQTETNLRKLNLLLRDLQSELGKITDQSSADWQRVSDAIAKVEGKIGDAKDRLGTITGEPLERVNAGLGLVTEGLMNLDFDKATIGIKGMTDGFNKLNFADLKKGIKDVGTEFINLGKALLTNPYFYLVAATVLIITNFEKLRNMTGILGDIFKALGKAVDYVVQLFSDFTDYLGLTNNAMEKQISISDILIEKQKQMIENSEKMV